MPELHRECRLLGRAPLIVGIDALGADAIEVVGRELVAGVAGIALATSSVEHPAIRWNRPTIVVELRPLSSEQRAGLWLDALASGTSEDGQQLANHYPLAPALVRTAAEAIRARTGPGHALLPEHVSAGVRAVLDDKLRNSHDASRSRRAGTTSCSQRSNCHRSWS